MGDMNPTVLRGAKRMFQLILFGLTTGLGCIPAFAQVSYSVRVEMEKSKYLLGEPIFCRFVIQNTGDNGLCVSLSHAHPRFELR